MTNIKLIVLDYDGTLVGSSGIVSQRVKKSLQVAVKKGIKVSVSTGRSPFSLNPLIRELNLDLPHVFLGGALVFNPIKDLVLVEDPISPPPILEVIDFAEKNQLYLEMATIDQLYKGFISSPLAEIRQEQMKESLLQIDLQELAQKEKILVMRMVIEKHSDHLFKMLQAQMSEKLSFHVGFPFNSPEMEIVNITDISVSKVSALRHLCQYLKISPKETMAIGDSPIDLPLIKNVGLGIAMGNAKKEVKEKAKWVTKSVDEDGVAVALKKFALS